MSLEKAFKAGRRLVVLALVVLLGAISPPGADAALSHDFSGLDRPNQVSPLEKTYRKGMQALADGHYHRALHSFRDCLKHSSDFAPAMLGMAEAFQRLHQRDKAAFWIHRAVATAPDNAHVQNSLGRLLVLQGDVSAAKQAFQRAIDLDRDLASAWASLGDLYARAQVGLAKAVAAYQQALNIDPLNGQYLYRLGLLYARQGKDVKAADALRRATRFEPDKAGPKLALAGLAERNGQWEDAAAWVDQVLARKPDYVPALWLRADIATHAGDHARAVRTLELLTRLQPDNASAWLLLGANREDNGNPKGASQAYDRAVKLKPNLAPALNNFAWIAANQGTNLDRALAMARRAVALRPAVTAFRDTLAWVYYARGDFARANGLLSKLIRTPALSGTTRTLVRYHLGMVKMQLGDRRAAGRWLKQALNEGLPAQESKQAKTALEQLSDAPGAVR